MEYVQLPTSVTPSLLAPFGILALLLLLWARTGGQDSESPQASKSLCDREINEHRELRVLASRSHIKEKFSLVSQMSI